MHPWGAAPTDPNHAAYDCTGDGSVGAQCSPNDILDVGSRPLGVGRWGQQDLLGNVAEWTRDYYDASFFFPCVDCINLIPSGPNPLAYERVLRGGGFASHPHLPETDLDAWNTRVAGPPYATESYGFRCAR